ncbi:hydrolase [Pochonia chlamydosporia 170]|uniref:Hydrolase n=1 Tax=Pochonia chlamydosporia 170 TaxID=1380566 RepID=A0A179F1M1_METCM|nr:hydrolase [Pochonia chlamydosporia 170]OAQ59345.1 hydrolase [Pochonia chlamydosporia 170]
MSATKVSRGIFGWALDRLAGWSLSLPPETNSYTIEAVRIPLGNGLHLLADLYCPADVEPSGTVLSIGPYGRSGLMALGTVRLFACRGYCGLLVSVRGTFGSEGVFDAGETNAVDNQAIVAWMRQQSWYTGSFAMVGGSYLGLTQWAMLEDQPDDMAAAIISVGPHDLSQYVWGRGSLNLDLLVWAELIANQEDSSMLYAQWRLKSARERLKKLSMTIPLADAADRHFAGKTPWLRNRITRSDVHDIFWATMQHGRAVKRANLPILLITGWQDVFLEQTLEQYHELRSRNVDVSMTIGPWNHGTVNNGSLMAESFQYLEQHLAKRSNVLRQSPVRFYVNGVEEWRELSSWPPETHAKEVYLHPHNRLAFGEKPNALGGESTFTFNPDEPTPAIGGPRLADTGVYIDTVFEERPDALIFTTDALKESVEVIGSCSVELSHTSDNPNADLFIRLSDVDERGVSRYITETYQRLNPQRGSDMGQVQLFLPDCAHRFKEGHAIRLIIAGGNFPHYAVNLGTGATDPADSTTRPATHTIRHAEGQSSRLTLLVAQRRQV